MTDQQDSGSSSTSASSSSSCCKPVDIHQVKNQISNKLQSQKSLALKLHSILTWEQDIYIGFVVAAVTFLFIFIQLLNSSVLATISYVGIIFALVDLAAPFISKKLASLSATKLTDKDNQRFDKLCLDLAKIYAFFQASRASLCLVKTSKPKVFYPSLLGSLLVLAYIGNKVNNLFLTYLLVLIIALYPGLEKRGIAQKLIDQVLVTLGRAPRTSSATSDRRGSGKKN